MSKYFITSAILMVLSLGSICCAEPIANAGPDQTVFAGIDGFANVELDGTASTDPNGGELTYNWTWQITDSNQNVTDHNATGPNPEIILPVGTHTITLVVTNDANVASAPDEVVITVVAPLEIHMQFTPQSLNCASKGKWVKAQMKLPEGYTGADVNTVVTATIEPYGLPAHHIHVSKGKSRKVQVVFDRSTLARALSNTTEPTAEIIVVGQLKSGQFFFGTDTIKVIKKTPKKPKTPKTPKHDTTQHGNENCMP